MIPRAWKIPGVIRNDALRSIFGGQGVDPHLSQGDVGLEPGDIVGLVPVQFLQAVEAEDATMSMGASKPATKGRNSEAQNQPVIDLFITSNNLSCQ